MTNPYEPPQSKLAETTVTRPVLVWIISLYLGVSLVLGIIGQAALQSGVIPIPDEQAAIAQLSAVDWVYTVAGWILAGGLCVTLFRMQAVAFPIGIAWMALGAVGISRGIILSDFISTGPVLAGIVFGAVMISLTTLYVYRLKKRGLLR